MTQYVNQGKNTSYSVGSPHANGFCDLNAQWCDARSCDFESGHHHRDNTHRVHPEAKPLTDRSVSSCIWLA